MAIQATTVWRVRPSGSNINGGGFDSSRSGVLSTTLSGTLATGATSASITSATGWPGSGNYYARLGATIGGQVYNEVVQVTAGQGTGTWTIVRARLGTADPGVTWPAGTTVDSDLSQCNTAPATGTAGASTASTNFVDATFAAFNSTHVGNVIWLASATGTPTAGAYVIQSVTNATTVVLDRVSGTYTLGVWKLGGAWADPQTNLASTGPVVPGNAVYVLGSGIPNSASYTTDYTTTSYVTAAAGSASGTIKIQCDPCTPSFSTGGRPVIRCNYMVWFTSDYYVLKDLWFLANGENNNTRGPADGGLQMFFDGVTVDQNGYDVPLAGIGAPIVLKDCRCFSSVAKRGTNAIPAVTSAASGGALLINSNISGCIGDGVYASYHMAVIGTLISKNGGMGLNIDVETAGSPTTIVGTYANNTIDANAGHGLRIGTQLDLTKSQIFNNIISNHTTSGKYPIYMAASNATANERLRNLVDYNVFYNNLNAPNALNYGVHDTTGGADPYVSQSTNDYTLTSTYKATGYPQTNLPGY